MGRYQSGLGKHPRPWRHLAHNGCRFQSSNANINTNSARIFYRYLKLFRDNALGNFKTLISNVAKSPSMMYYLNNQANTATAPDENFARELMELFTLGRGNYTEKDVKEAARAFTGCGANLKGDFQFRKFQHDFGSKTVLGRTRNFDEDEVLDILLEEKQTAILHLLAAIINCIERELFATPFSLFKTICFH